MLKNLTITAEEEVIRWVKHQAVEKGVSASKFVGDLAKQEMNRQSSYSKAYERWMKIEPVPGADASKRMTREEVHERRG